MLPLTLLLFLYELSGKKLALDYLCEALFILCLGRHRELLNVVGTRLGFHQDILVDHLILRCSSSVLIRSYTLCLVLRIVSLLEKRLLFNAAQKIVFGAGLIVDVELARGGERILLLILVLLVVRLGSSHGQPLELFAIDVKVMPL